MRPGPRTSTVLLHERAAGDSPPRRPDELRHNQGSGGGVASGRYCTANVATPVPCRVPSAQETVAVVAPGVCVAGVQLHVSVLLRGLWRRRQRCGCCGRIVNGPGRCRADQAPRPGLLPYTVPTPRRPWHPCGPAASRSDGGHGRSPRLALALTPSQHHRLMVDIQAFVADLPVGLGHQHLRPAAIQPWVASRRGAKRLCGVRS
jgi:hypothetical protein